MSDRLVSRCLKVFREAARIVSKQNNVKGAPHHEKNSHVYLCARGYTGKYCERGSVVYVMGNETRLENDPNQTMHKRKKKQEEKNKAKLIYEFYP